MEFMDCAPTMRNAAEVHDKSDIRSCSSKRRIKNVQRRKPVHLQLQQHAIKTQFGLILHDPFEYDGLYRVSQSVLPALFREELDQMLRRLPSCRHLDAFRATDQDVERLFRVLKGALG